MGACLTQGHVICAKTPPMPSLNSGLTSDYAKSMATSSAPMLHRGLEERLVIEVDGSQHLERALLDARQDDYLESLGFRVLRFWDNQLLNETDAIIEVIAQKREEGPPSL